MAGRSAATVRSTRSTGARAVHEAHRARSAPGRVGRTGEAAPPSAGSTMSARGTLGRARAVPDMVASVGTDHVTTGPPATGAGRGVGPSRSVPTGAVPMTGGRGRAGLGRRGHGRMDHVTSCLGRTDHGRTDHGRTGRGRTGRDRTGRGRRDGGPDRRDLAMVQHGASGRHPRSPQSPPDRTRSGQGGARASSALTGAFAWSSSPWTCRSPSSLRPRAGRPSSSHAGTVWDVCSSSWARSRGPSPSSSSTRVRGSTRSRSGVERSSSHRYWQALTQARPQGVPSHRRRGRSTAHRPRYRHAPP